MLYNKNFKFGMTNLGDAGLDLSWTKLIDRTIGSIISSKVANDNFANALLKYKDKIIYHVSITGLGGTGMEPKAPSIDKIFNHLKYIIDLGFPKNQIVLKIDPIMPMCWVESINGLFGIDYLNNIRQILKNGHDLGIERVRHNFLKLSPCILNRLYKFNSCFIFPKDWKYELNKEISLNVINDDMIYESTDLFYPYTNHVPIVSNEDLYSLGLNEEYIFDNEYDYNNLIELIFGKTKCAVKCAYCDFDDPDETFLNFNEKVSNENIKYDMGRNDYNIFGKYLDTPNESFNARFIGYAFSKTINEEVIFNKIDIKPTVKYSNEPYESVNQVNIDLEDRYFCGFMNVLAYDRMKLLGIKVDLEKTDGSIIEKNMYYDKNDSSWFIENDELIQTKKIINVKVASIYCK